MLDIQPSESAQKTKSPSTIHNKWIMEQRSDHGSRQRRRLCVKLVKIPRGYLRDEVPGIIYGIGEDCAVIKESGSTLPETVAL